MCLSENEKWRPKYSALASSFKKRQGLALAIQSRVQPFAKPSLQPISVKILRLFVLQMCLFLPTLSISP